MLKARINHQIKAASVRVLTEEGEQIGILPLSEALSLAQEHGLDLVEIAPMAKPPVCKVIDFSKFKYQQKKAENQAKKHAHKTQVKTIRLSARIGENDLKIKAEKVKEILGEGDVVHIELRMRGREQAFPDLAKNQVSKFLQGLNVPFRTDSPLRRMGPTWSTTISQER